MLKLKLTEENKMRTLLKCEEVYRVETETAVEQLIEEKKKGQGFELISYTSTYKEKKPTKNNPDGDSYWVVKFKMEYNKENNPRYAE